MARFPSDPKDLWKIKMRPEKGYISLVSWAFNFVDSILFSLFPLAPDLVVLAGTMPQRPRLEALAS